MWNFIPKRTIKPVKNPFIKEASSCSLEGSHFHTYSTVALSEFVGSCSIRPTSTSGTITIGSLKN